VQYFNERNRAVVPKFLKGVIAPMFTPCKPDGSLDPWGAAEFANFLCGRDGISSVFPRSGLGRMYTFTKEEVKLIIDAVIDAVAGDAGVIPGTAGIWDKNPRKKPDPQRYTAETTELSLYAQEKGADGVVIVMPEALPEKPKATLYDRICAYYQEVSSAINIPIVIYHPPGVAAPYRITPELFQSLLEIKGVTGMKYSMPDMYQFGLIALLAPKRFALIAGHEGAFLSALALGAVGVIGQGCCVCPEILRAVYDHFRRGDWRRARKAQRAVNKLLEESAGIDIAVFGKQYANEKGYDVPLSLRKTEQPVTVTQYSRFETALELALEPYEFRFT